MTGIAALAMGSFFTSCSHEMYYNTKDTTETIKENSTARTTGGITYYTGTVTVTSDTQSALISDRKEAEIERPVKTKGQLIVEETVGKKNKETRSHSNPNAAKTDKSPPSRRSSDRKSTRSDKGKAKQPDKPSVREELERIKAQSDKSKGADRKVPEKKAEKKTPTKNGQTKHKQPKPKKKKTKER